MLAQPSKAIRLPKATGSTLKIFSSSSRRSHHDPHTQASSPRECFWFARLVVNEGKKDAAVQAMGEAEDEVVYESDEGSTPYTRVYKRRG